MTTDAVFAFLIAGRTALTGMALQIWRRKHHLSSGRKRMIRLINICIVLTVVCTVAAHAQLPETLEQAKALASEKSKPLLVEFFHDD